MRYIYQIPISHLSEEMANPFYFSDLNDVDVLPEEVLLLLKQCKENDRRFTVDNFELCFNLMEKECDFKKFKMFYPDEKFNAQIQKSIK